MLVLGPMRSCPCARARTDRSRYGTYVDGSKVAAEEWREVAPGAVIQIAVKARLT